MIRPALAASLALLPPFLAGGDSSDREGNPEEKAAVQAFLGRFDAACRSGEKGMISELLAEGAASCRRRCESILRRCLPVAQRQSELLLLRASGDALGAFVRAEIDQAASGEKGAPRLRRRRHEFLLLRREERGPRLLTLLEFDPSAMAVAESPTVSCEGCNWTVEKPPGWFAVARSRECCGATEAISFLPPEGEPSIEVRVFDLPEARCPLEATKLDDERLCRQLGLASAKTLKRRLLDAGSHPACAESEILYEPPGQPPGRVLRCYYLHGTTLYALVASGGREAVERVRGTFDRLRESFALVDPARPAEESRSRMLGHHPGGRLEGNAYSFDYEGLRLSVRAPEGWTGVETSGPAIFRVRFRSPSKEGDGAFLDVYAVRDPAGWLDHDAVAREIEARDAELRACGARDLERSTRTAVRHPGLRAMIHRSEATWRDTAGRTIRELLVFAPVCEEGIYLAARAEREAFDRLREAFEGAVESLSRP
ncbi:MAG: hypothetical protein L0323_21695 [Planctomycetes bacterium]|nr:hypothetical protein [Planctomycetota bacterium]